MNTLLYGVDAFTHEPFRGNPAAVCVLETPATPSWMQQVAAEMNLSETAFLVPKGSLWGLRWFTPTTEVALCGHATLASAHVLWEIGRVPAESRIRFQTEQSGILECQYSLDGIRMDFPSRPALQEEPPEGLCTALGAYPVWVGRSEYDYLVELEDESAVKSLKPDFGVLEHLPVRGVIVTARGSAPYDFVSRFFAPAAGVPEDPVTGSAHCTLAPHWARRLGRVELTGWQASRRGGEVQVHLMGDRVRLGGRAVTVWRGEFR